MTGRARPPSLLLVAVVVAVFLLAPSPQAGAWNNPDWNKVGFRRLSQGCPTDGQGSWNPYAQVSMGEFGKSGVVQFEARFQIREAGGGSSQYTRQAGFEALYRTSKFPNDYYSRGQRIPGNRSQQWTNVLQPVQMDVKFKWIRVWYKPNFSSKQTLVVC